MSIFAAQGLAAENDQAISFVNDVMPVLTKAGCNTGVCHAKAGGGQNGFQLSLLGFEPQEDYESLVKEGRGRRLFRAAPERSLLLMKASGQTSHGGGIRLARDSKHFSLIREWIEQGTPYADSSDPELASIEVRPERGVVAMNGDQQLQAVAKYSDGSVRDITQLALFESNDEAMADVSA
ncbi:MAG: S-layer protein, partial [Fuerstiella sp.]